MGITWDATLVCQHHAPRCYHYFTASNIMSMSTMMLSMSNVMLCGCIILSLLLLLPVYQFKSARNRLLVCVSVMSVSCQTERKICNFFRYERVELFSIKKCTVHNCCIVLH